MDIIAEVRRRHPVGGEKIGAIARSLNPSRTTVRKYLDTTHEPSYHRSQQPEPEPGPV